MSSKLTQADKYRHIAFMADAVGNQRECEPWQPDAAYVFVERVPMWRRNPTKAEKIKGAEIVNNALYRLVRNGVV